MIKIRAAVPEDAAAIAAVHVEAWRSTYPGMIPTQVLVGLSAQRQSEMWRRTIANPANEESVFVAVKRNVGTVGFASVGRRRTGALPFTGEVYTLYVARDHQGRGVGRALLRRGFQALGARGHGSALVWVLTANPSRFFYRAMGGAQVAERVENLWGAALEEAAFGWLDLAAALRSPALAEGAWPAT